MSDPIVAPVGADTSVPAAVAPAAPMAPATTTPAAPAPVAAPVVPPAPPAAVAPVASPAPAAAPPADSKWLAARLEGAKNTAQKALLAELGFSDVATAKAAAAEAKARADAGKTAEQKAAELAAQLTTTQTAAQQNADILTEHAARMFGVLSPTHQALVKSFAGDDPALIVSTIGKLTDSGVLVYEDEPAPGAPPPATTAPPPVAPGGTTVASPPDHKATYEALRQGNNPFKAAIYGARNPSVYQPKA